MRKYYQKNREKILAQIKAKEDLKRWLALQPKHQPKPFSIPSQPSEEQINPGKSYAEYLKEAGKNHARNTPYTSSKPWK